MKVPFQPAYFVFACVTSAFSIDEVKSKYPQAMIAHITRSREFQKQGSLVMAGALDSGPGEPVSTLAVLTSREAAEEFARGDPFVLNGLVVSWSIRPWANILQEV